MKRINYTWMAGLVLAGLLVSLSSAQSLGDYARSVRKDKTPKPPAAKQYDNDNLPKSDKLSIVGNAEQPKADANAEAAKANDEDADEAAPDAQSKSTAPAAKDAQQGAVSDQEKSNREWQQKIKDQKNKVDLLSRELDVMQREYKLRAAAFYADAGNRLRSQGEWDKQDAAYKQKLADKQSTLDEAKQKLEDTQEQARKAGVPSNMRE